MMNVGDLVKHRIFGVGVIYETDKTSQGFDYWKAVDVYGNQNLAKCIWSTRLARIDSWVSMCHLEVIDE